MQLCASLVRGASVHRSREGGGTWRLPDGELTLDQQFQNVWGTYEQNGISLPVENGLLRGDEITFSVNKVEYWGRVSGDAIEGVAKGRETRAWRATLLK